MRPRPFDWRHTPGIGSFAALALIFLYAPLAVLVVYSFNANTMVTVWSGFSLRWYGVAMADGAIRSATFNSLIVAVSATILSTIIATLGALALERGRDFKGRGGAIGLVGLPLVVPEIVTAVTTLVFFAGVGLNLGLFNLVIAHTVFCIPFAMLPIQARLKEMPAGVEDAARDLYADERRLFLKVTLPLLAPGIMSGAMLAFVTSLDDFLISLMLSGAGTTTLPVYIYSMLRIGVTPEINAVSTMLLALSLVLVVTALALTRRRSL